MRHRRSVAGGELAIHVALVFIDRVADPNPADDERAQAEIAKLRQEILNLTNAIASGVDPSTLREGIDQRKARLSEVLAMVARQAGLSTDLSVLAKVVPRTAAEWSQILRTSESVAEVAAILKTLIKGKLECSPAVNSEGKGYYVITGEGTLRGALPHNLASPTGTAARWGEVSSWNKAGDQRLQGSLAGETIPARLFIRRHGEPANDQLLETLSRRGWMLAQQRPPLRQPPVEFAKQRRPINDRQGGGRGELLGQPTSLRFARPHGHDQRLHVAAAGNDGGLQLLQLSIKQRDPVVCENSSGASTRRHDNRT